VDRKHAAQQAVKTAVLVPNITGFPSESMLRYAVELGSALRALDAPGWRIEDLRCDPDTGIARRFGDSMASRHARFLKYPMLIRSRSRSDIFHVVDHSHANLTLASPARKTVVTCHDMIPLLAARGLVEMPHNRFAKWMFPLRILCMRRCARIIAISESTKRNLIEHGGVPEDKIRVVYYGYNPAFQPEPRAATLAEERAALRTKHGIPDDAPIVLQVATATRYKNTPVLLQALKRLSERSGVCSRAVLLRVGAEFFPDEQDLIAELGLGGRIHHAGRTADDEILASYYRAADVFAFPSLWEGFGWPVLEAMACGAPVVVSRVASLPEVVGEAGVTIDPRDPEALAASLATILENPNERQRQSVAGLTRARRFSWQACARDTLDVYEGVLAET